MSKLKIKIRDYTERDSDIDLPYYMEYSPLGVRGGGFIKIEDEYLTKQVKMDQCSIEMTTIKTIPASYFLSSNNYTPCAKEEFERYAQEAFSKGMSFLTSL